MGASSKPVLIASSHDKSRHVVAIMLHKMGYTDLLEATSMAEVENLLAKNSKTDSAMSALLGEQASFKTGNIALAIIDCNLEPKSGTDCLRALRTKFSADRLPVLMIGGEAHCEELKKSEQIGANETLSVPFTQNELKIKVNLLLGCGTDVPDVSPDVDKPAKKGIKVTPPKPMVQTAKKVSAVEAGKARAGNDRSSFYGSAKAVVYSTDGEPTATLVDGKIDGHYHETVEVIGGGVNCFWAKQVEGEEMVRLEYISRKGRPTGIEAKVISVEQFMYTFYLCEEHGCPILTALAEEN